MIKLVRRGRTPEELWRQRSARHDKEKREANGVAESDAEPHAPIKLSHGNMQLRSVPREGRESRNRGKQLTLHETGSTPLPALWDIHVGTIQGGNGRTTEQLEGTLQISAQYLNCSRDPRFARCGKAIGIGTPTENRASPETNCLDNVGAPTNASVHQYLNLTVYRCHHLWQGTQRGGYAV